ncbi:Uncharacterised protein [Mycobacteroides abscessus subsp. abscessus]|nr:Uncharacterised protein [Mycobacteroides abscessus subsp. abscessus]
MHAPDVPVGAIAVGHKPIQVQPVRVELSGAHGHQGLCLGQHVIEQTVDGFQPIGGETILVGA